MDVGDFVGDSGEDSGVEDVSIEQIVPVLVGVELSVDSESVLEPEIESRIGGIDRVVIDDAPCDQDRDTEAAEHAVVEDTSLVVDQGAREAAEESGALAIDGGRFEDENAWQSDRIGYSPVEPVAPHGVERDAEVLQVSAEDRVERIFETSEEVEHVNVAPQVPNERPIEPAPDVEIQRKEEEEEKMARPRGKFKVGDIVHVAARTWPGINKLGGAGKIASMITDTSAGDGSMEFLYNVKYMLGGFEKRIEEEYIQDLADALETGVRQHKERVFYHDEFAVNHQKKAKPLELEQGEFWPQPEQDPTGEAAPTIAPDPSSLSVPPPKRSKKKRDSNREKPVLVDAPEIEFQLRSSDDSDYDGSDDDDGADAGKLTRRLGEDAFILDERHAAASERKPRSRDPEARRRRREKKRRRRHRDKGGDENEADLHSSSKSSARKKRSHRIIESDEDQDDSANDHADSGAERLHGRKKRRYIGGYEVGSEDMDGSFIQPEGNPGELPDDVAHEVQFKLGKTKAELRVQLDTVADRLAENLREFETEKRLVARQLDHALTLQESELHDVDRKLRGLGGFIRAKLIRSGEDVMNTIIKLLERKGGTLPERIDNEYESRKRQTAEHDIWVKQSLRALDTVFERRGLVSTEDLSEEETSSESYQSPAADNGGYASSDGDVFERRPSERVVPRRHPKSTSGERLDYGASSSHTSAESNRSTKKRPRHSVRTQSSMDNFAVPFDERLRREQFNRPSAPAMSNFRFVREKDLLKRTTDPRWDWVRKLKRSREKGIANSSRTIFHQHKDPSAVTKKPIEGKQTISVMEAVLKLRDKRYRARTRPTTYAPYPREARSTLLPKPLPLVQQSSIYTRNSFEYEEPTCVRQVVPVAKPQLPELTPKQPSRKWSSIFSVLPNDETLPTSLVTSTVNLMRLGRVLYADRHARDEDKCWPLLSEESQVDLVQASALGQQLNRLRFEEHKAIRAISKSGSDVPLNENTDWITASTLGEEYHAGLGFFIEQMQQTVHDAHPADVVRKVKSMIVELANLLKQIPDCNSIFSGAPDYGFYFEVLCPGARSTPLFTAICRTYWYAIQGLVYVKRICETQWPDEALEWNDLFVGTLPPNRVALAVCLFLIDLYVHVHSTHHIPNEPESMGELSTTGSPALSLWLLLHELFSVGILQSTKGTEAKTNGGFWNFLQEAYRKKFVDEIVLSFVKQESCGGYVKERALPTSQGEHTSDEDWEGQLLANDTLWDICGVLGVVFQSTSYPSTTPPTSSSWTLLKELLPSTNPGFVPINGVTATDVMDEEFKVQAYGFQLRMLRRILVFSATWPPEKDFVEKLLPLLWEASLVEDDEAMLAVVNFIGEVRTLELKSSENLLELANRHASQTTSSVALFCKIVVLQLVKQDKSILRTRFRQPVLRALSARLESQQDSRALLSHSLQLNKELEPVEAAKKATNKSWNWGKSGSKALPTTNTANALPTTPPVQLSDFRREQIIAESKTLLSVLLMFALSSVYLEDGTSTAQQTARRQKELKREIEYFSKEFSSVSTGIPDLSVQLCHCVHAIGVAALDARSSYATAFEQINSQLKWISDKLQQSRRIDINVKPQNRRELSSLSAGVSSCLEALHDLSSQLVERLRVRRDIDPAEIETVQASISIALGAGIASSLELAADGGLSRADFETAIGILVHWLPRSRDTPSQSLRYGPSLQASSSQQDEFDEFDDAEMMDLLATVDLADPAALTTDYDAFLRTVDSQACDLAIANLRLPLQRLLISLPLKIWRSYEELFLMDLLGAMIASCSFTFSWSVVSMTSLKPRNFAPRLLSAVLKHRPEKEWFSTCFLSEQNADVELSNIWLTATLDLQSLLPMESRFAPVKPSNDPPSQPVISARYSSYWLMLTDGILANLLKENPVVRFKIDQGMYQLLHDTATNCSFRQSITRHSDPTDTGTLYTMHEDVFRTFCRSAGHIWTTMVADPVRYRADMNRFRSKMMDAQRGVFVALPDAYEINLRAVCTELDRKNINWYSLSSKFLDEFTAPQGTKSLHAVDDAVTVLNRELTDPVIRPLVVLFKLMYDCVDSFLFNCGGMAIGQQNIFYSIIELMFRQARCAEFPVAERRLKLMSSSQAPISKRPSAASGIPGISPACGGFVESARLFFAYQKYPSLMNWFAQNLDTYQTLKAGWDTSPLRVLLYNIFDPHGPLGIHSYYPIQDTSSDGSQFEPSAIRREAFYLACGLVNCRCTSSYEHTRHSPREDQEHRRAQLRQFVLTQFVNELKRSAHIDGESIDETLLPVLQFVKAFVNHLNLDDHTNLQVRDGSEQAMRPLRDVVQDLLPCLVAVAEHIVAKLILDRALVETMSCVLMIEFCRIIEEIACLNTKIRDSKLSQFVDIALRCASFAYESLRKYSSSAMEDLFAVDCSAPFDAEILAGSLRSLLIREDVVVKTDAANTVKTEASNARTTPDDYGISKVRVRSDLLSSIRRLVKQCSEHGESRLLRTETTVPAPSDQASDVGTM